MRAPGSIAPLIHLLISALYIYRLLPHLSFFRHFFPYFSIPFYLSFPLRIDTLHFQTGGHKGQPGLF